MIRTFINTAREILAAADAFVEPDLRSLKVRARQQKRERAGRSELAHLTPRVIVRDDGLAYITFKRPRPQKGTP